MNWRQEDAIFKRFMAGASIDDLANEYTHPIMLPDPEIPEQAIRNAIRRRRLRREDRDWLVKKGGKR